MANSARLDDVPAPPLSDGAILVRTLALGVCATDREIVAGEYGSTPPGQDRLVLGHESLGRILLTCALPPGAGVRTAAPVTVDAGSLEAVLARMPILSLDAADELGARVAIVVVLGVDGPEDAWRVTAAHLLRPPLRDGHGHLQRQGPAVLATWDPALRRFEHFAWAVLPELAALIDRRAGDLDADVNARTDLLAGLVAHGIDAPGAVRLAIEAARVAADATPHRH